jgi:hypothetical protein
MVRAIFLFMPKSLEDRVHEIRAYVKALVLSEGRRRKEAAVVIQALWRGYSTRARLCPRSASMLCAEQFVSLSAARARSARGRLGYVESAWMHRRLLQAAPTLAYIVAHASLLSQAARARPTTKPDLVRLGFSPAANRAACKIQASWRGMALRIRMRRHFVVTAGAVRLQALWRGWRARRGPLLLHLKAVRHVKYLEQVVEIERQKRVLQDEAIAYLWEELERLKGRMATRTDESIIETF